MELEWTRLFIKVIQHGGFSKAAQALKIPKSTISKAIARLERETGTQLLMRTTRTQTLTEAGRLFYQACLEPLQTLEEAQKSLYGMDQIVSGHIKITAPEDLGNELISPVIGRLAVAYPQLHFELHYTNERVDLIKGGYDLAVRIGAIAESRLRQRKLGEVKMIAVASPKYLQGAPPLRAPKDLQEHRCLAIIATAMTDAWVLKRDKSVTHVKVHTQVRSNQVSSLIKLSLAGAGVALVPQFLCQKELADGRLVPALRDWWGQSPLVSLLSPMSTLSSARLNLVSSEIARTLKAVFANSNSQ